MAGIRINAKHGTEAVYVMRVVACGSFENRVARVTSAVFNNETAAGVTGDRSLSDGENFNL